MLSLSNGGFKTTTRHALLVQVALFWRSAFCGFCVDMVLVTRGEGPLFNKSSPEQLSLHSNLLHDQQLAGIIISRCHATHFLVSSFIQAQILVPLNRKSAFKPNSLTSPFALFRKSQVMTILNEKYVPLVICNLKISCSLYLLPPLNSQRNEKNPLLAKQSF